MSLIVQKYGGTSVANPKHIRNVAKRVMRWRGKGHDIVVVVSAMSGETDRLLALINATNSNGCAREKDVILSTGEQVTIGLLSLALEKLQCAAVSYTGLQAGIQTDSSHSKARITEIDRNRIRKDLQAGQVVVVAGFQGVDGKGNITTLGRGGSDTTAVALAVALGAEECQIYTDVDGVYSTDPRVVPKASHIPKLALEEMLEMASQGAKVLQIRAVEFAYKYDMPIRVLSSFDEENGKSTLVTREENIMEEVLVRGVAFSRNESQLTIEGVQKRPGVAYTILGAISDANIEVDMIVQNASSDDLIDFSFTVNSEDYENATKVLGGIATELKASACRGKQGLAKVSIVGGGMRSHAGNCSPPIRLLPQEVATVIS